MAVLSHPANLHISSRNGLNVEIVGAVHGPSFGCGGGFVTP